MFAPIGALMATIIPYREYSQHQLPKGCVVREVAGAVAAHGRGSRSNAGHAQGAGADRA
ncbi:hypothetical protein SPHINGO361_140210 [Sphingomonas sp. EC-HK361]|nr:hypothetical protein [Sphingomonas sp. 67-41]VVT17970.1 hypothetical protein SPHINGO361_140210 [Sphingomonas sp. EC-HK361]